MTPQLGDVPEPGLGVGSSTRSSTPWALHRADRSAHCRWKVARESLWLHVVLLDRGQLGGKDTEHLLVPVKGQTRAAGTASGHSQCPRNGGVGEMSQGEGGQCLAGGSHSKMSWSKVPLESVWV